MKLFILLTGLGEILVGLTMLIKPKLIPQFAKASSTAITTARMYGAAAISIGVFALLVWDRFNNVILHNPFLIVFLVFHVLVALAVFISVKSGETKDSKVAILHTILALATAYFLWS